MTDALTNLDRLAEMWADLDPGDDWRPHIRDAIREIIRLRAALAAPPVAPARVPLTDAEVDDLARTMVKANKSVNWLCRAIEAAHGITAKEAP